MYKMKKTKKGMKNLLKKTTDKSKRRDSVHVPPMVELPRLENSSLSKSKKREHETAAVKADSRRDVLEVVHETKIDPAEGTEILKNGKKKTAEEYSQGNRTKGQNRPSEGISDNASVDSPVINESSATRDQRTIFIGNLPVNFKKKKLIKLLKQHGKVEKMWTRGAKPLSALPKRVALIKNKFHENHPPLIVHALFERAAEAHNALKLNGELYDGNRLRVTMIQEKVFDSRKGVFVGNLPFEIKEDDLFDFFLECGEITNVRVVRDVRTGAGKGFGYVNFKSADSVELALNLNEEKLNSREIRVHRLLSSGQKKKMDRKKCKSLLQTTSLKRSFPMNQKNSVGATEKRRKQKKSKVKFVDSKKKILAQKLSKKSRKSAD